MPAPKKKIITRRSPRKPRIPAGTKGLGRPPLRSLVLALPVKSRPERKPRAKKRRSA